MGLRFQCFESQLSTFLNVTNVTFFSLISSAVPSFLLCAYFQVLFLFSGLDKWAMRALRKIFGPTRDEVTKG